MLLIVADVHEESSGVPQALKALGAEVETRMLPRGDYLVGSETAVERKTVDDLHASIQAGRLWAQMGKIRAAGRWPYLLLEGRSIYAGPIAGESLRGLCLAVSDLGITIIRTEDEQDTARWLFRLAIRRQNGAVHARPVYAQRPRSTSVAPSEAALAAAPGVSVETARLVLAHFGSLHAIGEASVDNLRTLQGIGIKRATAIVSLLHDPWIAADAS